MVNNKNLLGYLWCLENVTKMEKKMLKSFPMLR